MGTSTQPIGPPSTSRHLKLGQILVEADAIDSTALENALALQKECKEKLGQILIKSGAMDDVDLGRALARQFDMHFVRLADTAIHPEAIAGISPQLALRHRLIGYQKSEKGFTVALADPSNQSIADDLRFIIQKPVDLVLAPQSDINQALGHYYGVENQEKKPANGTDRADPKPDRDILDDIPDIQNLEGLAPTVRLSSAIIGDAIRQGASDVHIEPSADAVTVRCRIDGIMYKTQRIAFEHHKSLVSRIKIISKLDIYERRKPQDGKTQVNFDHRLYDLRISTIPTSYGEKVTIRILDPRTAHILPQDLGFTAEELTHVRQAIHSPQGIVLVTGPTGSGKSSTLYACINEINTPSVNIITVEDPVEYDIAGINQVQISPKAGITFASGLRSILRQDPDIVMIGEIRDRETAAIAFEAAQTGHLVLSTLHTNDAPSAVTRLLDLGVKDFLIADALILAIGQRLLRKICPYCKKPVEVTPRILKSLQPYIDPGQAITLFGGEGCEACRHTGYAGRLGAFETLVLSPAISKLIKPEVSVSRLKRAALKENFKNMHADGIHKALAGLTTVEEVFRIIPPEKDPCQEKGRPSSISPAAAVKNGGPVGSSAPENLAAGSPRDASTAFKDLLPPVRTAPLVLVVDDDVVMRKRLQNVLEERGLHVVALNDGEQALAFITQNLPDLVITDFYMPRLDGIQLIQKIRQHPATSTLPIIMLTAEADEKAEIRVIEAGADDYLTKPVNFKRLVARVDRFVSKPAKVLIVDDDKTTRRVLSLALDAAKLQPITAANAIDATKIIVREKPDLIITDYSMPRADGVSLIRALKSHSETSHIPIIMLTARDEVDLEIQALQLGADEYMTKPIQRSKLLARVHRLIKRNQRKEP